MNLGYRLEEQRKNRQFSQAQAAALGGVSREMWGKYERNRAVPGGEVLTALASAGWDVAYILAGRREIERKPTAPPTPTLTREQQALLDNYEACGPEGRDAVRRTAAALARPKSMNRKSSG